MQISQDQNLFILPCEQFFFTVASNPQLLKQGYEIVYKYLSASQQNREQTLLHLLSEKAPVLTLVSRTYPVVYTNQTLNISNEEKAKTKEYLILEVLLKQIVLVFGKQKQATKKNLSSMIDFLLHFHNIQGFQQWVGFYEKLLSQMIQASSPLISFILKQILKNSDDRVSSFSKYILPFIISNQSLAHISEEDSLEIIYYCVKSMGYMNGTEDDVLEQYYEPYEAKILEYIQEAINKSEKIMKFSLKILTVLVAEYEVELEKQMIKKLKEISRVLVGEFFKQMIKKSSTQQFQDQEDDEQTISSLNIIIYQLIELFETLLSCQQIKLSEYETFLALCLPSLILSKPDYLSYNSSTETYLADIQDEGQKCLRNKVVSFLLEIHQSDYPAKTKNKMEVQIARYAACLGARAGGEENFAGQISRFFTDLSLQIQLEKEHLPLIEQSITFLLYQLTEQILTLSPNLEQAKHSLLMTLGKNLEVSSIQSENRVIKVAYMNLLNKLVKSMDKSAKQQFYVFLLGSLTKIIDFQREKGFVLTICRGIAYVAGEVQLIIVREESADKGIPIRMLQNLVKYLLDQQTLQESAHLILQFFLTLLKKCPSSLVILQGLLSSQTQIHILTNFIHDGTIADVVIDLLAEIASEQFVKYVYEEFVKGSTREQNLTLLIARWVQSGRLRLTESDLKGLLIVYKGPIVAQIIKEFLVVLHKQKTAHNLSQQMVSILNTNTQPNWILPLITNNILLNPQSLLLSTINAITYELTSQYELENNLLLPFYSLISNPLGTLTLIKSKSPQLYSDFFTKLIRYATLFHGLNLKVVTSHVLLNVCEIDNSQLGPVFELIQSYGKSGMQTDEWEDEEDKHEDVVDRMFYNMRMTNDEVEKEFSQIFGNIVYDMAAVNAKVDKLTHLLQK